MKGFHRLGFELTQEMTGSSSRTIARFACVRCHATYDVAVKNGEPLSPIGISQKAARAGWQADASKKTRILCPSCLAAPRANDPDELLRKVVPMTVTPIKPAEQPTPSADQRLKIRSLLDKHFDDGVGMYLDGMTDQRLSEMVGCPRIVVETIREVGYGPIRVDPVVAGLRGELEAIKRQLDTIQASMNATMARLTEAKEKIDRLSASRAA
jgi:hypothetical protein